MDTSVHGEQGPDVRLSWEPADLRGLSIRSASLSTIGFRGGKVIEWNCPASGPSLPKTSAFPTPPGRPSSLSPATLDPRRGCFQFRETWKECRLLLPLVPLFAKGFCSRQELPGGRGLVQELNLSFGTWEEDPVIRDGRGPS